MNLIFSTKSKKFLKNCNKNLTKRIIVKCKKLQKEPFPKDTKRVICPDKNYYRVRVGDYRILYEIREFIYIILIDKRANFYKKMNTL